jgi:hypothetical protein
MKERKSRKERAQRRRCDADNPGCRRGERICPITKQTGLSASPARRASSQLLQIMNWPCDLAEETPAVRLHPLTSRLQDEAARQRDEELTATETILPSTDLRLLFTLPRPS